MEIYDTLYMLAAVEQIDPEPTFFKSRYFPTHLELDIFNTSKVLADYRENTNGAAPFVLPRIGSIPVGRAGYSTAELEPGNISISMPLTLDQLQKRGFGESLLSTATPEERARKLLMGDLSQLSAKISRTEEWLACDTMLHNGTTMRHRTNDPEIYEDVPVKFYDGDNPGKFTPAEKWQHSTTNDGIPTPGNWYHDIVAMVKSLTKRGRPATDLLVANDVGAFLMEDPWVLYMMDNRRAQFGELNPEASTPYVTNLGRFNFSGRWLNILVNDGVFTDHENKEKPFLENGSVIVTAPDCGRGLYGAVTQKEMDSQWHSYAGMRVPNHISTIVPPADETILSCRPLFVPKTMTPWISAVNVFTD